MWQSLGLVDLAGATISSRRDGVDHSVDLDKHLAALTDEDILWGAVLVHSYALVQNAAVEELGSKVPGIENWGQAILERNGKTWTDVKGGLAGAVEVAVVRNAIAHGTRRVDENSAKRIKRTGGPTTWRENSKISFGYAQLRGYRNRLKDLLVQSGLGSRER